MSATEMIYAGNRVNEVEIFFNWLSDNGCEPDEPGLILAGVREAIYGPVVASNMEHMRECQTEPQLALAAIRTLTNAAIRSSSAYYEDNDRKHPGAKPQEHDFTQALGRTQGLMASGVIEGAFMPEAFAMTTNEGLQQVNAASRLLISQPGEVSPSEVRRLLSDTNYSLYFSFRTMANGEELLKTTIQDEVENKDEEQMPHVKRTNLAMGQYVGALVEASRGRVSIIDAGPGTGATLAASISALNQVSGYESVSLYAIESNRDFYSHLAKFSHKMVKKIEEINPAFKQIPSPDNKIRIEDNVLNLVHDDVTDAIENLESLPNGAKDTAIITANYIWHRLPSQDKRSMMRKIGDLSPNSIFLVADLVQNGSEVNRRYFNFGNNGPLNCGNVGLGKDFETEGYKVLMLGRDIKPTSIHPTLIDRISQEATNDGYFWIAYKGEEAERLVYLA